MFCSSQFYEMPKGNPASPAFSCLNGSVPSLLSSRILTHVYSGQTGYLPRLLFDAAVLSSTLCDQVGHRPVEGASPWAAVASRGSAVLHGEVRIGATGEASPSAIPCAFISGAGLWAAAGQVYRIGMQVSCPPFLPIGMASHSRGLSKSSGRKRGIWP